MIKRIIYRVQRLVNTISKNTFPDDFSMFLMPGCQCDNFFGMNQQFVRTGIILKLLRDLPFDAFIETGTNTGATSFLVAVQTKQRVLTCEINPDFYRIARRNLLFFGNRVQVFMNDSKCFLKQIFSKKLAISPFVYLDAHWLEDLPLKQELEIILSNVNKFVIVIDDFKVPTDSDFGYDSYGSTVLEWDYIKDVFSVSSQGFSVFYPAYPSKAETGKRRGWIIIASKTLAEKINQVIPENYLRMYPY